MIERGEEFCCHSEILFILYRLLWEQRSERSEWWRYRGGRNSPRGRRAKCPGVQDTARDSLWLEQEWRGGVGEELSTVMRCSIMKGLKSQGEDCGFFSKEHEKSWRLLNQRKMWLDLYLKGLVRLLPWRVGFKNGSRETTYNALEDRTEFADRPDRGCKKKERVKDVFMCRL